VFSALSARSNAIKVVSFDVVTAHDPAAITKEKIQEVALISPEGLKEPFDRLVGTMNVRQLSNAMKHHEALCTISTRALSDTANLIIEDDVLYNEDLLEKSIVAALARAPNAWDLLFLGLPAQDDDSETSELRYSATASVFKCLPACDSYLVTTAAAARLSKAYLPIRFPTNIHLSWLLLHEDNARCPTSNTYVISPSVFIDGSKYGSCTSSINANNRLAWNPAYIRLFTLVRGKASDTYTKETEELIDRTYEAMTFKSHPDAQYLYAISLIKRAQYEKAGELMASALETYEKNNCNVNRSSEFLNAYCDLHRYLQ
jgi:GR25 family glycosyltransferase involved in LPS biosynthesis